MRLGVSLGIGIGRRGNAGAYIAFSGSSVLETAPTGTVLGNLSVQGGTGTYTFSEVADPDNKFTVASGGQVTLSATVDYENKTFHTFTVSATNGTDAPITRAIAISVTNVFEQPNLGALALSASQVTQNQAATVNITGATAGSTITGTVPDGMTLNSGARTITGTPTTVGNYSFALTETLADSANSPRGSNVSLEVVAAAGEPAAAPTLTQTSADGGNPLAWDTTFTDLIPDDSDYVVMRYREGGGAWITETPQFVDSAWVADYIVDGLPIPWPLYDADTFAGGTLVGLQVGVIRGGNPNPIIVQEGDSITAAGSGGYATLFSAEYPQYTIYNQAVGGNNINNLEDRLQTTLSRRPDVVSVLIGANGISPDAATYAERVLTYCDNLKAGGVDQVVLCAVLPIALPGGATQSNVDAHNAARVTVNNIFAAAEGTRIDVFNDWGTSGMMADADAQNTAKYGDGVHPTDTGSPSGHDRLYLDYEPAMLAALAALPVPAAPVYSAELSDEMASASTEDPTAWASTTGPNKSQYITISGAGNLTSTGQSGFGNAPISGRTTQSRSGKRQFQVTLDVRDGQFFKMWVGVDNGTDNLADQGVTNFSVPGKSNNSGVALSLSADGYVIYKDSATAQSGSVPSFPAGIIVTVEFDTEAGTLSFYRTISGTTVQMGTMVTGLNFATLFPFVGFEAAHVLTANFASGQARALTSGYVPFDNI